MKLQTGKRTGRFTWSMSHSWFLIGRTVSTGSSLFSAENINRYTVLQCKLN